MIQKIILQWLLNDLVCCGKSIRDDHSDVVYKSFDSLCDSWMRLIPGIAGCRYSQNTGGKLHPGLSTYNMQGGSS